jgi:superfamily I DNA and/or RNA helicase
MNNKEKILEAWIMVEHLSEGDIKLSDKNLKKIKPPEEDDYYTLFLTEIEKKELKVYQKGGIVLYFDIFKFEDVIALLREKYNLPATEEEIKIGNKFSFAVYFDKELRLEENMTFFTESYYILEKNCVPNENVFLEYEEENKKYIKELFECPEDENYAAFFNKSFIKLISKYSLQINNSRMKVLTSLESDATNLHSFFVADLEKAKTVASENLDKYLLGIKKDRINLDSRKDKQGFNPLIFQEILQPKNYPMSRFPSNSKYALSFMQQVAVNLAVGYDNEQMRSVNGPPGTGKTTLLKDIFSELIVEQAYEITELKSKEIKDKLLYFENAGIGKLPQSLAEKGIVVASSNNGAVQNIVNELPLISGIDGAFIEELRDANYFWNISNSNISTKWEKDEKGKNVEILVSNPNEDEKFWGLFSLEGGKKDNMDSILTSLKHIAYYLENDYEPDTEVYDDFKEQYEYVLKYRRERQDISEKYLMLRELKKQLNQEILSHKNNKEKIENEYDVLVDEYLNYEKQAVIKKSQIEVEIRNNDKKIESNSSEQEHINQEIEALKLQKPGFFSLRKVKRDYKERMRVFSEQLLFLLENARKLTDYKNVMEKDLRSILSKTKEYVDRIEKKKKDNENIIAVALININEIEKQIQSLSTELSSLSVEELDMDVDYGELQLSNPWFDEEYRKLQSKLFIAALKLRKQFLYDNLKSIKASYIIWNKQKDYLDNKQVIAHAWNWINMVIPVISSTFASINTMCKNLEKDAIGYLFVDEAGQALPQASVGAIFRSKQVMVVGDPAQIKPVLTLDSSILRMLGKHYEVSGKYLSNEASTQTLVDDISRYGFYKTQDKWIGIPLWVHRRCKNPMFDISNAISYDGNMVQSTDVPGKAYWYDVSGSASDKYVKEQGEFLRDKILELFNQNPDINDKSKKDIIYVISPFKNVAYQLSQELKQIGFTRYGENGKPTNIGTVHTFQGKEAPIVFLVLGCDERSRGAANWAMGSANPNIMNVAATRAKEEFYIIGDKQLFLGMKSDVINETYRILERFNNGNK